VSSLSGARVSAAALLNHLFNGNPAALLFTVMVCCPLLNLNLSQAWVQDHYLAWASTARTLSGCPRDAAAVAQSLRVPQSELYSIVGLVRKEEGRAVWSWG
jgi:hypothetical protein